MSDGTSSHEPEDNDAFKDLEHALDRAGDSNPDDGEDLAGSSAGRGRTLLLSLVFAAAVLLLSAVIGYTSSVLAVARAEKHTDARVGVLESDLQQRRAAAAEQNANRDSQIAQLRRLVCVFADHAQPRDEDVEEVRAAYGCTATPSPSPTPTRPR